MPRPPGSSCSGVWRMGVNRLCIARIIKRLRSFSAALALACFWLCLISVISPSSKGQQGYLQLKEDPHLLPRFSGLASYPALLGLSPLDKRMETSSSVKLQAKLVLRNQLKTSITGFQTVMKASEDGQTGNVGENGIIGGRRIQEIKSSQMGELETLSRRYDEHHRAGDTAHSVASSVFMAGEEEQIDTKAITVMEIRPDIQTQAKNLEDLRVNWTRELQARVSHFSAPGIPQHEQLQTRQESKASSDVSSRAKNRLSKSASRDRKTRSEAYEMPAVIAQYALQAQGKSISSHLPQSISAMRNRQSNSYDGMSATINRHFNSDELHGVPGKKESSDADNSPGLSIENSYLYLTQARANLDSATNTQSLNTARSKSNLENSVAEQMNAPKGRKEFPPYNLIDQNSEASTSPMNPSVNYPARLSNFHEPADRANARVDGPSLQQTSQTTNVSSDPTRHVMSSVNSPDGNAYKDGKEAPANVPVVKGQLSQARSLKSGSSHVTKAALETAVNTRPTSGSHLLIVPTQPSALKYDGFQLYSYNVTASDALPYNREIPDTRPDGCPHVSTVNSSALPKATIIICFHNEAASVLLRTVYSVLSRTSQHLLDKIILVDDFSPLDATSSGLKEELKRLSNVVLTRTETREGLVRARLLGASLATSEVIVFLDSHCECNVGWLEPLLVSLAQDGKKVVSPYVDTIRADSFQYKESPPQLQGGFNWRLEFGWRAAFRGKEAPSQTQPILTPVISGGLFAVRREYFTILGSYDPQLNIWGGENFELSFKVWMCGGSMEIVPCSRVGHVFRASLPYSFTGDREETVLRNLARVASVWMDEYADIFYAAVNLPKTLDIGNISDRVQMRQNLKCRSFQWYLDSVFPQMEIITQDVLAYGQMRNKGSLMCVDVMRFPAGYYLALSPCHGGRNQTFSLTRDNQLKQADSCIVPGINKQLGLSPCNVNVQWLYKDGRFHLNHTSLCLTSVDNELVQLLPCEESVYSTSLLISSHQHKEKVSRGDAFVDSNKLSPSHANTFQQWTLDYTFNWKRRRRRN